MKYRTSPAPFAFIGSAYDARFKEMYTAYSTKDLLNRGNLAAALTGTSAAEKVILACAQPLGNFV